MPLTSKNKILITGASGIIGKVLLKYLEKYEIYAISRTNKLNSGSNINWVNLDLSDFSKLKKFFYENSFDTVIHLAWENLPDYTKSNSIKNYFLTMNLFEQCLKNKVKSFISTGSCWEYGDELGQVDENSSFSNLNEFAQIKRKLAFEISSAKNELKINWLRLFYVFGPGQRKGSLIPTILNNINIDPFYIFKNPYEVRDYIYVHDVARVIKSIVEQRLECGIMNVSSGNLKTPLDFYNEIRILNKLEFFDYSDTNKKITNYADLTKFYLKLGEFQFTSFSKSIKESI